MGQSNNSLPEVTVEQINSPSELVTVLRGQRVHLSIPDELDRCMIVISRSISLLAPHSARFSLFVLSGVRNGIKFNLVSFGIVCK